MFWVPFLYTRLAIGSTIRYYTYGGYHSQMTQIHYDYSVTPEVEFLRWLDTVSVSMDGLPIERPTKSLDERVADKEKRIKRKIEARLRRQRAKEQKRLDSQLSTKDIECLIQRKLYG